MQRIIFMFILLQYICSGLLFAGNKQYYTINGTLPDSIDNVYVYLTPINLFSDSTSGNNRINRDSALVRKGRFVFNGTADTQKNLYSIRSEEYFPIGGFVVVEPGIITYSYRQDNGKEYVYARGTRLNDLLTDSILVPSMRMAKYGEAFMKGTIDKDDPKTTELISQMRNDAALSWIQIVSNKGKSDNIAAMYGIYQIPRTVLINSERKIVSDNLRGQELMEKIDRLLK